MALDTNDFKMFNSRLTEMVRLMKNEKPHLRSVALLAVTQMHAGIPMLPEVIKEQAEEYLDWLKQG